MLSKRTFVLTFTLVLLWGKESSGQGVPDQIQQFLQKSFFNPIKETVKEGVSEISGLIQHIHNHTSPSYVVPAANNETVGQSTEKDTEILPNSDEVLANTEPTLIVDQEQELANSSTYETGLIDVNESIPTTEQSVPTTILPVQDTEQSAESTKTSAKERSIPLLETENIEKLKTLCPKIASMDQGQINLYRYFEPKEECYRIDGARQGPCGSGMAFYRKENDSINGQCECKVKARLQVYHEETESCYSIFTQGYCPEGQWVDLTKEGQPICKPNPCLTSGEDRVMVKGKCVEVGKKSDDCGENERVEFRKTHDGKFQRNAVCTVAVFGNVAVGSLPCTPGNSIAIHGKCHASDWEFGDEEQNPKK